MPNHQRFLTLALASTSLAALIGFSASNASAAIIAPQVSPSEYLSVAAQGYDVLKINDNPAIRRNRNDRNEGQAGGIRRSTGNNGSETANNPRSGANGNNGLVPKAATNTGNVGQSTTASSPNSTGSGNPNIGRSLPIPGQKTGTTENRPRYQSLPATAGNGPAPAVPPRNYPGAQQPTAGNNNPQNIYNNAGLPVGGQGTNGYDGASAPLGGAGSNPYDNANAPLDGSGTSQYDNPNAPLGQQTGLYDAPTNMTPPNQTGPYNTPSNMALPGQTGLYDAPTNMVPQRLNNGPTEVYSGIPRPLNGPTENYSGIPGQPNAPDYGALPWSADGGDALRRRIAEQTARANGVVPVYGNTNNVSIGQYGNINGAQPLYQRPLVPQYGSVYRQLPLSGNSNGQYQSLPANAGNQNGQYQSLPANAGNQNRQYQSLPANAGNPNGQYQSLPANAGNQNGQYRPLPANADGGLAQQRRQQEAAARARGIRPVYGDANNVSVGQYGNINGQQPAYQRPLVPQYDSTYRQLPLGPSNNAEYQTLPLRNQGGQRVQNNIYTQGPLAPTNANGGYQLPAARANPNDGYTQAPSQPARRQ